MGCFGGMRTASQLGRAIGAPSPVLASVKKASQLKRLFVLLNHLCLLRSEERDLQENPSLERK